MTVQERCEEVLRLINEAFSGTVEEPSRPRFDPSLRTAGELVKDQAA
ncbi:MAG TPA: hypothetical protein VFJ85_07750 [Acidimicrobiales bacterium]|nr:hypothetical protein [Acidimicrobiales bacterium]